MTYITPVSCMYYGLLSRVDTVTLRLLYGYVMITLRLHYGYVMITLRLHYGYFMVTLGCFTVTL